MKYFAIIAAIVILMASTVWAAGTATWKVDDYGKFKVYRCFWTSDASGVVSPGTGVDSVFISGGILGVHFFSDAVQTPTNLYDVQLVNSRGQNILSDGSTNYGEDIQSAVNSNAQRKSPRTADGGMIFINGESIVPNISNAGAGKSGVIELIVW